MNKSYTIIRINPSESSLTVLFEIDGKTLQQDVFVKSFDDLDYVKAEIKKIFDKFESDLAARAKASANIPQELQDLVDQNLTTF